MSDMPTTQGRIMVVDDIEDNRDLLCRALKRAGFETESYDNGVDAISRISTSPPDLLMLDWMMPGLSGLEVLCAVREHYDANELPVIMCTARDESGFIGQAIKVGANDYVQKPVDFSIAIARITAQLERRAALRALSSMNRDLEAALAQRTRALLDKKEDAAPASDASAEADEILRLASWLRSSEAGSDPVLLSACADSLMSVARRIKAA